MNIAVMAIRRSIRAPQEMIPCITEHFGHPASRSHAFGCSAVELHQTQGRHLVTMKIGHQATQADCALPARKIVKPSGP